MIFTFTPLVWGAGADILSEDGKTATLDTPQMRKAIDVYRGMVEKDLVPAGAASDNGTNFLSFTNGKIGQQSLGAFAIGTLVTQHPDINFGVTLIPGIEGGPSSFAGGDNLVITKGTPTGRRGQGLPRIRLFARGPEDPRQLRQPADPRRHRRRGARRPRPAAAGRPWRRSRSPRRPIRCSSTT